VNTGKTGYALSFPSGTRGVLQFPSPVGGGACTAFFIGEIDPGGVVGSKGGSKGGGGEKPTRAPYHASHNEGTGEMSEVLKGNGT